MIMIQTTSVGSHYQYLQNEVDDDDDDADDENDDYDNNAVEDVDDKDTVEDNTMIDVT